MLGLCLSVECTVFRALGMVASECCSGTTVEQDGEVLHAECSDEEVEEAWKEDVQVMGDAGCFSVFANLGKEGRPRVTTKINKSRNLDTWG